VRLVVGETVVKQSSDLIRENVQDAVRGRLEIASQRQWWSVCDRSGVAGRTAKRVAEAVCLRLGYAHGGFVETAKMVGAGPPTYRCVAGEGFDQATCGQRPLSPGMNSGWSMWGPAYKYETLACPAATADEVFARTNLFSAGCSASTPSLLGWDVGLSQSHGACALVPSQSDALPSQEQRDSHDASTAIAIVCPTSPAAAAREASAHADRMHAAYNWQIRIAQNDGTYVTENDGSTFARGRLELRQNADSAWGTVCEEGLINTDSALKDLLCAKLGVSGPSVFQSRGAMESPHVPAAGGAIAVGGQCAANATSLGECSFEGGKLWPRSCYAGSDIAGDWNAVGGEGAYAGFVDLSRTFLSSGTGPTTGPTACSSRAACEAAGDWCEKIPSVAAGVDFCFHWNANDTVTAQASSGDGNKIFFKRHINCWWTNIHSNHGSCHGDHQGDVGLQCGVECAVVSPPGNPNADSWPAQGFTAWGAGSAIDRNEPWDWGHRCHPQHFYPTLDGNDSFMGYCYGGCKKADGMVRLDLGRERWVHGVVMQPAYHHYTRLLSYKVSTSLDDETYTPVDGGAVFQGNLRHDDPANVVSQPPAEPPIWLNWGSEAKVESEFAQRVRARYVKVLAETWYSWVAFRFGVNAC
jgi:hypothetical protein